VAFAVVNSLPFVLNTQHPLVLVQGVSMQNTYFDGDLLILKGIATQDIHIGNVVVYQRTAGTLLIVHRVVNIITGNNGTIGYFIVQGDNRLTNQVQDAPVPPEEIVGTAIYHIPAWLGRAVYTIVLTLQYPFLSLLVLPLGLVIILLLMVIIILLNVFRAPRNRPVRPFLARRENRSYVPKS
jgi:signal peptidase I